MSAKKPIQKVQLFLHWEVGQMNKLPRDESLMVAGLDLWEKNSEIF